VASGGPSGSSLTLRVLFVMSEPYGGDHPGIKHVFERRVAPAPSVEPLETTAVGPVCCSA
jgi:hypothetical protein